MASNKLSWKLRRVTYPKYESKKEKKGTPLQRIRSADMSYEEQIMHVREKNLDREDISDQESSHYIQDARRNTERDLSLEGRPKRNMFRHSHSTSCAPSPRARASSSSGSSTCEGVERHFRQDKTRSAGDLHLNRPCGGEERLLDWSTRTADQDHKFERRSRSLYRNSEKTLQERRQKQLCACKSVPPTRQCSEDIYEGHLPISSASLDTRSRSSQLRRMLSLFSVVCDKEVEKSSPKKILRPPTKHVYRKGVSGLPVRCSPNRLGLVC